MCYPRAIQVPRLLNELDASIVLLCGEEPYGRQDDTIAPGIEKNYYHVIREPFYRNSLLSRWDVLSNRFYLSLWSSLPDVQREWVHRIGKRYIQWQATSGYRPDLVITFGSPMSDHLFGLRYKKKTGTPWIAHFSDPWVDNPYRRDNPLTAWLNKRLEREVIRKADAVLFTSAETVKLVMHKYPAPWREKCFALPHCCDPNRYDPSQQPPQKPYLIRCLGTFYPQRSPQPFFSAVEQIASEESRLLEDTSFEIIGPWNPSQDILKNYPLAKKKIRFSGAVPYAESIRLMQTSHCLLLIDASSDFSVFFPSKLVDYIGSGRFILALSPAGTTERIVKEVGGWVADPSKTDSIISILKKVLNRRPDRIPSPTHRYDMGTVGQEMKKIIERVTG